LCIVCVSVALVWWQDRKGLEERIGKLEQRVAPTSQVIGVSWSPEQAIGPPNTTTAGDKPTAWATATQDAPGEWLELTYAKRIKPKIIEIHESYNPGAVVKVTAFDAAGKEHAIWQGADPTPVTAKSGISKLPVALKFKTDRIRIYLASEKVPGWNEIDAVGVGYSWGRMLWAEKASASSSYGSGRLAVPRIVTGMGQDDPFEF